MEGITNTVMQGPGILHNGYLIMSLLSLHFVVGFELNMRKCRGQILYSAAAPGAGLQKGAVSVCLCE